MSSFVQKVFGPFLVFFLVFFAPLNASAASKKTSASLPKSDILFMLPYEKEIALSSLLGAIASAKSSIKISIYSFTHNDIAKALKNAAARGVNIEIIYDKESNEKNKSSTIGFLAKYKNIRVCLLSGQRAQNGRYYGIMHQKLAIIDDALLALGSANWSKNAFENNFETLLFSRDKEMVKKALGGFERMRQVCAGY